MPAEDEWNVVSTSLPFTRRFIWVSVVFKLSRLRGRGMTLMGFLDPPLGYVWGEPIKVSKPENSRPLFSSATEKVTQQKPVDETYLNEVHWQR